MSAFALGDVVCRKAILADGGPVGEVGTIVGPRVGEPAVRPGWVLVEWTVNPELADLVGNAGRPGEQTWEYPDHLECYAVGRS
jgi:hypothetical protein